MASGECDQLDRQHDDAEQGGRTLYCPKCSYNLTGTEDAGLTCCPECGEQLDFDLLRQQASQGFDLSGLTYWRLCLKFFFFAGAFRKEFAKPHYFIVLPEISRSYRKTIVALILASVGLSVWIAIGSSGDKGMWAVAAPIVLLLAVVIHAMSRLWFQWLLGAARHPQPARALRQITIAASSVYFYMAVALLVFTSGLAMLLLVADSGRLGPVLATSIFLIAIGAAMCVVLWRSWALIAERVFACETLHRECSPGVRLASKVCPAWFVGFLLPVMLVLAACTLPVMA